MIASAGSGRWLRPLTLTLALLGGAPAAWGKESWTEIRSPHFTVYCEDGEKEGRKALRGFEAIRSVFGRVFPSLQLDPPKPMVVIVTRDEASMKRFLPASFEGRDPVRHAGYFQQGMDRDYALIRLDVEYQASQPYFVVFHEYAHAIIHLNFPSIPTWLDEGLADFYGATELHGNRVHLGRIPIDRLETLRRGGRLPLEALLTATQDSPYYQEGTKAGPFYAESWALVHYLLMDDKAKQAGVFKAYLRALEHPAPPLRQAQEGFGDLKALERTLSTYIQRTTFRMMELDMPSEPEGARPEARPLDEAESLVVQAEFLMSTRQEPASRPLLAKALALAPQRPEVHTALGLGAAQRGEREAARTALETAQRLGSRDFRVPYHLATLAQEGSGPETATPAQILAWLEAAQHLHPDFPGTWMALCRQYTVQPRDAGKALEAGDRAVNLEPRNLANWANLGTACLKLDMLPRAKEIGDRLDRLASSPGERRMAAAYAEQLARFEQIQGQRQTAEAVGYGAPQEGSASITALPPMRFSLPSNLAPLGQEVIQLAGLGQLDEAIQKVEAARKKVRSAYERNSLKTLLDQLKARKAALATSAQSPGPDPAPK
jgi:tetratricopeptide (TPR) repeat protein